MADLTVQDIRSSAGTAITFSAATVTAGDKAVLTDNSCKLLVNNASGGSINVTLDSFKTLQGLTVPNRTVAVAAGTIKAIPLNKSLNANPSDANKAHFVCSAVTSVTVAVVSG
jgi:hypothetical protein